MSTLQDIVLSLSYHPELLGSLDIKLLLWFLRLVQSLKDVIQHSSSIQHARSGGPPTLLPAHICSFIAERLSVPLESVDLLWTALRVSIWTLDTSDWDGCGDSAVFDELNHKYCICTSPKTLNVLFDTKALLFQHLGCFIRLLKAVTTRSVHILVCCAIKMNPALLCSSASATALKMHIQSICFNEDIYYGTVWKWIAADEERKEFALEASKDRMDEGLWSEFVKTV